MKTPILCAVLLVACASGSTTSTGSTTPTGTGGDVEARLAKLEATNARYAEALEYLNAAYAESRRQKDEEDARQIADDGVFGVPVADDVAAGQVDGPPTATVTIVKAFDFACPYCYRAAATMDALVADHHGEVRVVYKNLVVHPNAMPAHLGSCAAAKQGKYLKFKDAFWAKGFSPYAETRDAAKLGEANILAIAKEIGLDPVKFGVDMRSEQCQQRIAADIADLQKFHVDSTPMFFVNGTPISGAMPKDVFEQLIDAKLVIAKTSGVAPAAYYEAEIVGKGERAFRSKKTPKPR
ncbi:MAG: DsbA family protein [Proteobacteria bacterium]|nr:DsbA family protein [Pseudomonadota bacterium]